MNPVCEKIGLQLPAYASGELPEADSAEIRAHLESCPACREVAESLRLLHGAMRMSPLPGKLDEKRRAAILERHREAAKRERKQIFAKILQFPRPSFAKIPWLVPLARVAIFILLPAAFLLMLLEPASMQARRGQYEMIAAGRPSVQGVAGVSAFSDNDTYNPAVLRDAQQAVEESKQSTSPPPPSQEPAATATPSSESQIAMAGDVPVLGRLFRKDSSQKTEAAGAGGQASAGQWGASKQGAPKPPAADGAGFWYETGRDGQSRARLAGKDEKPAQAPAEPAVESSSRYALKAKTSPSKGGAGSGMGFGGGGGGGGAPVSGPVGGDVSDEGIVALQQGSGELNGRRNEPVSVQLGLPPAQTVVNGVTALNVSDSRAVKTPEYKPTGIKERESGEEGSVLSRLDVAADISSPAVMKGLNESHSSGGRGGMLSENGGVNAKNREISDTEKDFGVFSEQEADRKSEGAQVLGKTAVTAAHRNQKLQPGEGNKSERLPQQAMGFELANADGTARSWVKQGLQDESRLDELAKSGSGKRMPDGINARAGTTVASGGTIGLAARLTPATPSVMPPAAPTDVALGEQKSDLSEFSGVIKAGDELHISGVGRQPAPGAVSGKSDLAAIELRDSWQFARAKNEEQTVSMDGDRLDVTKAGLAFAVPEKPAEMETLKSEIPKPMFVGTPVPIKLPNLEVPAAHGTVASAYANGAYPATREYSVPNSTMARFDARDGYAKFDDYLVAQGVKIPPGAKASYDPATEKLVVSARPDTLESFDKAVANIREPVEKKESPSVLGKLLSRVSPPKYLESSRKDTAKTQIRMLETAVDAYNMKYGRNPASLDGAKEFLRGNEVPGTPWNGEYQYKPSSSVPGKSFEIAATTPDGTRVANTDWAIGTLALVTTNSLTSGIGMAVVSNALAAVQPVAPPEPVRPAPPRKPAGFNPYIEAMEDSFSTFSIDVDTASYTLTRRALQNGNWPDSEQVRTEEIVNSFDYDYSTPANGAFAIHTELAPSPFRAPLELLKIGIRGRVIGRDAKKSAALTLIIDTSGSMDTADRLGRIRPALRMLVDQLKPDDTVAIVTFNNTARLLLDRTRGADKQKILAAVDSLAANGSTQLEGGMKLGYEVASRGFISGGANRVVLMSDGVANLGAATADAILKDIEQYRKQGIYLTVLGFGSGNYDDAMLMQLADKGDGMYAFVDSDEEAQRLLVDQWEQTLHVIAKDVKIQVEFNPDVVKRWRQIGYEKRHLNREDFRNDAVEAGDVGSGQSVTALYDVEMNSGVGGAAATPSSFDTLTGAPQTIATVRVRYKDPDTGRVTELEQRVTAVNRHANFAAAPARFRVAACAAEFAELLRVSPYTAGTDMNTVAQTLRPAAMELRLDQKVQELLRLVETAGGLAK